MELQFKKTTAPCLRMIAGGIQTREETQEIRLPDDMPDIGRVICCWGQVYVRSKEWRSDGVRISGGVTVWTLYAPDDGSAPRSVECWVPYQARWDYSESARDGFVCVQPLLKSIDARSVSAKKLIVRVCVSLKGEALEPGQWENSIAEEMPEDVQLLSNTYPVDIPSEAGEKLFQVEYEDGLPDAVLQTGRILYYNANPVVAECKVMANRLVFRGNAAVHILYRDDSEELKSLDVDMPFSQYAELEREHSGSCTAKVLPLITGIEFVMEENRPILRCSVAAQYVIQDRQMVAVVEDGYSTKRNLQLERQTVSVPACLDSRSEQVNLEWDSGLRGVKVLDEFWLVSHPESLQAGDSLQMTMPGVCQILYLDEEDRIQCQQGKMSAQWNFNSASGNRVLPEIVMPQRPSFQNMGGTIQTELNYAVEMEIHSELEMESVSAVQLGENLLPDPERPSLIVCRAGNTGLWELAKENKTTVSAILAANGLHEEPVMDQMVLVPIR